MKKSLISLFTLFSACCIISSIAHAEPIVLEPGTYEMHENNNTIASHFVELDHFYYYTWCLEDLGTGNIVGQKLDVVFHGIYDWTIEDDSLDVYIRDGNSTDIFGWQILSDSESSSLPGWSSDSAWTFLGTWSDPAGHFPDVEGPTYDVVFSLNIDEAWATFLSNGGSFVIGIDPDCHYFGQEMTVNAPVPEPASLILLGSGLLGLAGFRRKFK